jgi:hypothetical protein
MPEATSADMAAHCHGSEGPKAESNIGAGTILPEGHVLASCSGTPKNSESMIWALLDRQPL